MKYSLFIALTWITAISAMGQPKPSPNDDIAKAIALSESNPQTSTSTMFSTQQSTDPLIQGIKPKTTLWWTWTPTKVEQVTITLRQVVLAAHQPVAEELGLSIYLNNNGILNELTGIWSTNAACSIDLMGMPNTKYWIQVGTASGSILDFNLSLFPKAETEKPIVKITRNSNKTPIIIVTGNTNKSAVINMSKDLTTWNPVSIGQHPPFFYPIGNSSNAFYNANFETNL